MKKIIAFVFIFVIYTGTSIVEATLEDYVADFNAIADDFASGEIDEKEAFCKWYQKDLYFRREFQSPPTPPDEYVHKEVNNSDLINDLKSKYEKDLEKSISSLRTSFDVPDLPLKKKEFQIAYKFLRHIAKDEKSVVTYYSFDKERSVVVGFAIGERGREDGLSVIYSMAAINNYGSYEISYREDLDMARGDAFEILNDEEYEKCINEVLGPIIEQEIKKMKSLIQNAREEGVNVKRSERKLREGEGLFERGEYRKAIDIISEIDRMVKAGGELAVFRSMNKEEQKEFLIKEMGLPETDSRPDEEGNVRELHGEDLEIYQRLGAESFGMIWALDGEHIHSISEIIDLESKTVTTYENEVFDHYDLSVWVDLRFVYEIALIGETGASYFELGRKTGKGILTGAVKVRPIWKTHKIMSILKLSEEGREISEGITSAV